MAGHGRWIGANDRGGGLPCVPRVLVSRHRASEAVPIGLDPASSSSSTLQGESLVFGPSIQGVGRREVGAEQPTVSLASDPPDKVAAGEHGL